MGLARNSTWTRLAPFSVANIISAAFSKVSGLHLPLCCPTGVVHFVNKSNGELQVTCTWTVMEAGASYSTAVASTADDVAAPSARSSSRQARAVSS
jgi:hypothetical protein